MTGKFKFTLSAAPIATNKKTNNTDNAGDAERLNHKFDQQNKFTPSVAPMETNKKRMKLIMSE